MNVGDWLLWGFLGTLFLTTTLAASQGLGYTRMNIPFMLGEMFTTNRDRAKKIGFAAHLMNGWLFALVYIAGFHAIGWSAWYLGLLGGLAHALFVLTVVIPNMPAFHPRMADESAGPEVKPMLEPPGFLALNYGVQTPLWALSAHAGYGLVLGTFYSLPVGT
jgi:hypothetical protein